MWPTQPSIQLVSGALFREVKRPAGETWEPPPFSAGVMNEFPQGQLRLRVHYC